MILDNAIAYTDNYVKLKFLWLHDLHIPMAVYLHSALAKYAHDLQSSVLSPGTNPPVHPQDDIFETLVITDIVAQF